ncbi:MAG: primosomal protein N' [Calditerrivibrio sp.]|nr:primosomal protein N' [Calditerrivibrio sp.]
MYYYKVAPAVPYIDLLTYRYNCKLNAGTLVKIEVGRRIVEGIVFETSSNDQLSKIKDIISVNEHITFPEQYLKFIRKLSQYYSYPLGTVIHKIVPTRYIDRFFGNVKEKKHTYTAITLNDEQQVAYEEISKQLSQFGVFLIYGVTGSGKTEVYCKLINDIIHAGGQVLYIVPEIALTSQLYERLSNRLIDEVAVYHSKIADKKREQILSNFNNGNLKVLLGARSSLFVPGKNIKMIIIDEEHDSSFKQEDIPHYHTRDMAILYAKILNIPIVLGSATPSLESYQNAISGKYHLLRLNQKFYPKSTTDIVLLDMKKEELIEEFFSKKLYDEIHQRLKNNEQTLLLINKKGYASNIICNHCGSIFRCPNCDVSLTYYKKNNHGRCHYCDEKITFFICSNCNQKDFKIIGTGSEKIYELLNDLFPDEVIRLDQDTLTSATRIDNILKEFESKKKKILVGTQIIAKGLNYPDITLIGVINIDNMFTIPDFRIEEKSIQILTQFLGRGGRFEKPCKMLIQTYNPENYIFEILKMGDLDTFYKVMLQKRKALNYPPFCRLIRVLFEGPKLNELMLVTQEIARILKSNIRLSDTMLGPSIAPISKIKNRYRVQVIIKIKSVSTIPFYKEKIDSLFNTIKKGNMTFTLDVDPYNFM